MTSKAHWILSAIFASLILPASQANAADYPDWAYPANPPAGALDATTLKHLPDSTAAYTAAQVEDNFGPPDWFPADHPPMPNVVAHGSPPAVWACSKCHVTNGGGHPESSDLAHLPVAYIEEQVGALKSGARKGARAGSMIPIAKAISDADLAAAAQYFASLKPVAFTKTVESATAPKSVVGAGGMRLPEKDAGDEPLGDRIIELPVAPERIELRDSRMGFVAYVPVGSIAKGAALAAGGGGKTMVCATCHGADLHGVGNVPPIAGRPPIYIFRQLNDIKLGTRTGGAVQQMAPVVVKLDQDDMIALSAYLSSRAP